jgi:peptide/nickel transport system substrate-binding protein
MSLRTRRGLALSLALVFVAAACTAPAPATPEPGTPGPGDTPAPVTPAPGPGDTPAPVTPAPGPDDTPAPTPDTGEPQPGGTIIIGEWQEPLTIHPFMSNAWVTQQAAMPVIANNMILDASGEWLPYLLAEMPVAEETADGGMTLTMRVKPGLTWSDGEALDANDIGWTYDWAVEMVEADIGCGLCGSYALRLPDDSDYYVTGYEVSADGSEITFNWQQKYSGWLSFAATGPLPQQYFENIAPADIPGSMPLSDALRDVPASGPFVFDGAGAGRIDYLRNDNFTAFDGPYLDGLRRQYFGTKDGMITAFLTGDVDQISNMTQVDYDAIVNVSPDIGRADLIPAWQYEHLELNSGGGQDPNRARPPGLLHPAQVGLDDVRVRNAIHLAINKEDLWNVLFPGHPYEEACTNAPSSTYWADPSITCEPYNPEAAMALLEEAGWTDTPRTHSDGRVMRLTMCTTAGNPTRLTTLGKVNEYLLAVGIPTDIRTADAGSVVFADYPDVTDETECALSRGNFHISLFTYLLGDPGDLYYGLFHSSNIPPSGGGGNWSYIADDELDTLLENALEAITTDEVLASLGEILARVVELKPEIPLYYRGETSGVGRHLGGFEANPSLYGPVWNIHEWHFIP